MTPAIKIALELLVALMPDIIRLVEQAVAGHDITHDALWEQLPRDSRTVASAAILEERRRAAGLPT